MRTRPASPCCIPMTEITHMLQSKLGPVFVVSGLACQVVLAVFIPRQGLFACPPTTASSSVCTPGVTNTEIAVIVVCLALTIALISHSFPPPHRRYAYLRRCLPGLRLTALAVVVWGAVSTVFAGLALAHLYSGNDNQSQDRKS